MSQTQSNQKITFPANSKDFFKVENNFPINKLLLQYLKKESINSLNKNTSFEKQTQIVRPFEFKIASLKETNDPEILFAKSNSDSFILAIQDEQTNCAGLIHFPIIENLSNFYKIGLKKFFDNFNQKNAKLASSFSENQNDEKSNLIIHIHGCRFEQIMDLIISEIHQNCQEKYNPILGSYNFNFINGGQIIVSDNEKFFAIDVTNREFFQDHSKEFYEKEIDGKNSLDEKDIQQKFSMIKDNQYDVFEESGQYPKTNIVFSYFNWILSFFKVVGV